MPRCGLRPTMAPRSAPGFLFLGRLDRRDRPERPASLGRLVLPVAPGHLARLARWDQLARKVRPGRLPLCLGRLARQARLERRGRSARRDRREPAGLRIRLLPSAMSLSAGRQSSSGWA